MVPVSIPALHRRWVKATQAPVVPSGAQLVDQGGMVVERAQALIAHSVPAK